MQMKFEDLSEFKQKGLVFQYWFTIIMATPIGLAIIFFPELTRKMLFWKEQDRLIYGITGSVYTAFGLISLLGLRDPMKYSPVLLLQFTYKMVWFIGVVGRLAVENELDAKASWALMLSYAAFIAGDLWGVPFKQLLSGGNAS